METGELDSLLLGSATIKTLITVAVVLGLLCFIGLAIYLILDGIKAIYSSWQDLKWRIKHSRDDESDLDKLARTERLL